jgi:hypothetical protein
MEKFDMLLRKSEARGAYNVSVVGNKLGEKPPTSLQFPSLSAVSIQELEITFQQ